MYRWDPGVSAKGRWATSAWTWWRGCVLPSICVFCYLLISLFRFPTPDFLTVWTFTHRTCKKETPVYQMFWYETVVDTPVTPQFFSAKGRIQKFHLTFLVEPVWQKKEGGSRAENDFNNESLLFLLPNGFWGVCGTLRVALFVVAISGFCAGAFSWGFCKIKAIWLKLPIVYVSIEGLINSCEVSWDSAGKKDWTLKSCFVSEWFSLHRQRLPWQYWIKDEGNRWEFIGKVCECCKGLI